MQKLLISSYVLNWERRGEDIFMGVIEKIYKKDIDPIIKTGATDTFSDVMWCCWFLCG